MSDPGGAAVEGLLPPRARTAPDANLLQSTPSDQGLSAASGQVDIHGVPISDLIPSVVEVVCKAQQCEADDMLEYILSRASKTPDDLIDLNGHVLLDKCINKVLPICNGHTEDIEGFPVSDIRKALIDYTACKQEDDLYKPFVLASNTALAHLKRLKIDGMREEESKEVQMFFQVHNSRCKLDIIVLPFPNYSEYFTDPRLGSWDKHVLMIGQDETPTASSWKDVLGVFELKRSKSEMRSPPKEYFVSKYQASKPKFLKIGKDGNELEETEPQEAPAVAERATLAEQAPLCRSARKTTQESTQMASGKRALDADSESRASKRSRPEEPWAHVTIQTALYAAEMQYANIAVKHALNCIVIGDNIWIWYYDRQGLISVAGFNFVQDLPRFLVLLYALQRFNLEDWGRNTDFKPHLKGDDVEFYTVKVGRHKLELVYQRKPRYGLVGRGTGVMDVTCETLAEENPVGGMVAKLYWAEEARISEEEILGHVEAVGKKFEDVRGHVPILLLSKRFPFFTSTIRRALGLKNPEKRSRTLVLLVFKKLSPIKELQGDELVDAWRQCVLCHYTLWSEGIHHRDVSHSNLMYYRDGDKVMGVLNDYDLSSLADSSNLLGNERTGTMPFMAIDLLEEDGQDGKVEHLYRHDMESFIYVFIWISLQYMNGKPLHPGPLDSWTKVDARECSKKKIYFLAFHQVPEDVDNYDLVMDLVIFLAQRLNTHSHRKATKKAARRRLADARSSDAIKAAAQNTLNTLGDLREEEDEEVYKAFLSQIPSVN
ncbi:hypothetical protein M404DRAFT_810069 [Pisolithus tinctorius Marx 270]|uniref:Fungal-type protein kinase domain-containing protein n=1 Tax=Pisolithus tinctorius Marx 270 TaxID=870435 RepID=A0A0C3JPS5_PISTI|nr:hypothetical protein M404DRAFT_810069 [Pisolithus tinctorius Marx 270]